MFKVIAITRKGNTRKTLYTRLTLEKAKAIVRNADWFHIDSRGCIYDLIVEEMK